MVDPNALRKFQRRAAEEFGQQYFSTPGKCVERLPDLSAVVRR